MRLEGLNVSHSRTGYFLYYADPRWRWEEGIARACDPVEAVGVFEFYARTMQGKFELCCA